MNEIRLTKDADALICVLYKEYLSRRKSGISKSDSRRFAGSSFIHAELMPKWSYEDVDETCRELDRAGLLACLYGDDVVDIAELTDAAIIFMENRFKDGLSSFFSHLEALRAILPW